MAWRDRRMLNFMSRENTYGNSRQMFSIKQEEFDSESTNLEWATESRAEQDTSDVSHGVKDANISVKKEYESETDEAKRLQGHSDQRETSDLFRGSGINFLEQSSLSEDFDFIRSCLSIVLNVDSKGRHELVRAMSSKLKYVEAITTGKSITKAIVKSEKMTSSILKLFKPQSNSRCNLKGSDDEGEKSSSDNQRDNSNNESEEEMMKKVMKSSNAILGTMGLITEIGDGSVKCNICERIITNVRRTCTACSAYVCRMRMRCREAGIPLPKCHHKNFSGGAKCKSCRLRKYVLLSKKVRKTPTRRRWTVQRTVSKVSRTRRRVNKNGEPQKCMICEKTTLWIKGWRCSACFIFHTRLIARYQAGEELPECAHDGSYSGVGCKGCRRIRLQREAALREPELASRLPEMSFKNTAHLDKGEL